MALIQLKVLHFFHSFSSGFPIKYAVAMTNIKQEFHHS